MNVKLFVAIGIMILIGAAIAIFTYQKSDSDYKQSAITTLSNNISNLYEDAIVTKVYDTEEQPREKVLESVLRDKIKNDFKDNFNAFSNCIIDKYKNISGKTFKELSNMDKDSFKNDNSTLQLNSLNCSDKQLSVLVFLMNKFKYCPYGQIISFVKQYIDKGIINKNRILFSDFEESEKQAIMDEFIKKTNCNLKGKKIEICLPVGPDGIDSCNPTKNNNKKCDELTNICGCDDGYTQCFANNDVVSCINLQKDIYNCGSCGNECASNQTCLEGSCINN